MAKIHNKTLIIYVFLDLVFLICGALLIALPAVSRQSKEDNDPEIHSVAQMLLLDQCPMTAALINGCLMLITFAISIPGLVMKGNRFFLTIHAWLLVVNAIFTLGVGLVIWFSTLQTKAHFAPVWTSQPQNVQQMLQDKFNCCGYNNVDQFVQDNTVCVNAAVAAAKGTCVATFSAFANNFLDIVFTSLFGFCAVDGLLLLSALCVLKDRAEKARYKLIDEKRSSMTYSYGNRF